MPTTQYTRLTESTQGAPSLTRNSVSCGTIPPLAPAGVMLRPVWIANAGEGTVRRHGGIPPFPETRGYVRKVLAHYQTIAAAPLPLAG